MRRVFVISDTHFNHTNIVRGTSKWEDKSGCRPFDTMDAHNRAIINAWNETVDDHDIVYHLGDVAFNSGLQLVRHLNGDKRLVLGNHDHKDMREFRAVGFNEIYGYVDVGRAATLTHGPLHPDHIGPRNVNIHGHIHTLPSPKGPYCNVSIEQLEGYRPILLEEAVRRAERNV